MLRRQGTRLACTESPENMSVQLATAEELAPKKFQFLLLFFLPVRVKKRPFHPKSAKSEALMLVEKIDLEGKKSPKVGKYFFCFFNFHITQKKLLDTLRVPVSRTRAPVRNFGPKNAHLTAHVLLGA